MPVSRRLGFGVALLGALAAAFWLWPRTTGRAPRPAAASAPAAPTAPAPIPSPAPNPPPRRAPDPRVARPDSAPYRPEDFPIAARLHDPDSPPSRDLEVLQELLTAWRTNFPREGNPVGENTDIAAALGGRNPLGLVLVPPGHPALNASGELCDRWGTPFRFHQLSGERMEVRSAGPDRKFATPDDDVWTPQ